MTVWPHDNGVQRIVIELKILYNSLEETMKKGLEQTWEYMDRCGADFGHLVIFDRTENRSWDEKIFCREELFKSGTISGWGM